ncbi:hypothetical protein Forpe1208_v012342 [Fusarium oxysporum f. sp. rapae]|uniref:Uncharacterized protein n=1 Tax=Fusarium oxysporum f. sp. rapae TaxID=485398 RepID=A0A8J5NY71_FUSOX|nr:hypothetical protein Forpe1208_v012342 [Fusarium oxysporum f. sp. rapae]
MAPPQEPDSCYMEMDALKNLVNNVPDWLQRLEDPSGQIDRRQAELAPVAAAEGKSLETKSLRNKCSTKSLKLNDNPPSYEDVMREDAIKNAVKGPIKTEHPKAHTWSPGSSHKQMQTSRKTRAKAPAERKITKKRRITIIYYDSNVQSFFNDLVSFVSSIRNLLRKAKKSARIARIKKLAEQEALEAGSNDDALPSLRYMSLRRSGAGDQPPGVYDKLEKGLEFVQDMCEHGAHHFLRDGDCNDEISNVRKRLTEVLEIAQTEMERVEREEPELAKETGELGKSRTRRPISMRRDMAVGLKESSSPSNKEENKLEAADHMKTIEVDPKYKREDPNIMEADEGVDIDMELPKLQDRSTRAMRSRGP